jgi:hypothetical protein
MHSQLSTLTRDRTLSHFSRASNLANAASLLWYAYKSLPAPSCEVNWAGKSLFFDLSSFPLSSPHMLMFFPIKGSTFLTLALPRSSSSDPSKAVRHVRPFHLRVECAVLLLHHKKRSLCLMWRSSRGILLVTERAGARSLCRLS